MAEYHRGAAAAAGKKQLTMAVLATMLIVRDLFETPVNTAVGGAATDEQVRGQWEKFMARRAASNRRQQSSDDAASQLSPPAPARQREAAEAARVRG